MGHTSNELHNKLRSKLDDELRSELHKLILKELCNELDKQSFSSKTTLIRKTSYPINFHLIISNGNTKSVYAITIVTKFLMIKRQKTIFRVHSTWKIKDFRSIKRAIKYYNSLD